MTPLPVIAAALILGVLLGSESGWLVPVAALCTVALGVHVARRRAPGGGLLLVLAAAIVGAVRGGDVAALVPRPRLAVEGGLLRGRVLEGCVADEQGVRCMVARDDGATVLLRAPATCRARPGDGVLAVVTYRPVAPDVNGTRVGPGAGLARRGVVAVATGAGCEWTTPRWGPVVAARRVGLWVRETLGAGLARVLAPAPAREARALLFGDTGALDRGDVDAFRDSGLAHLLAVSGAHVALLATLLGGFARAVLRRIPAVAARGLVHAGGALLPLPLLAVFVLATGESASAVRALVGAALGTVAAVAGRKVHGEAVVAASAVLTLSVSPVLVYDAGWQLSIVAAWALAAAPRATEATYDAPKPVLWRSVLAFWREALTTSARVAVAAAPVLAWHFQRTPATAIAANAIAAPLAEAVALPLVLAVGILGACLPRLGALLALPAAPVLEALFAMPRAALALPWATFEVAPPTPAQACALVATALLAMRAGARGRVVALAVVLLVAGTLELRHQRGAHPRGVLRVTALDVGQGDAVLVDLPDGAAMLVDAGGARVDAPDPGARVVVPVLADRRRRALAVVVASHPHPDHVGGLAAVLRWAQVGELWDTRQGERFPHGGAYARMRAAAVARGVPVRGPETLCGPPRAFHGATIEVLAPCPGVDAETPPNDASFVVRLAYGRAAVLLPGDLERAGEASVLARLSPVTLLKVGHHGSRTSSTAAFLDALRPRVALVSAGHPSAFGHPHDEVLERLRARRVQVWSTSASGVSAVTLRADGSYTVVTGAAVDRPP